jgi:hypothetical protein
MAHLGAQFGRGDFDQRLAHDRFYKLENWWSHGDPPDLLRATQKQIDTRRSLDGGPMGFAQASKRLLMRIIPLLPEKELTCGCAEEEFEKQEISRKQFCCALS